MAVPIPPAIVPVLARWPLATTRSSRPDTTCDSIVVFASVYAFRASSTPNTTG